MSVITTASEQWHSRPDDQRFVSLPELHSHLVDVRENSATTILPSRDLTVVPLDGSHNGLRVAGLGDSIVDITHWAFTQLAQRAGAPAGYLRDLPGPMAADCLNYGLQIGREDAQIGALTYRNGGPPTLRAVTGPGYGRVWNATITQSLIERFGDGVSGDFRVPGEFGQEVEVTKKNTTLYASDRDMFVFLADEKNRIEVPNRRDGKTGSLARGFFVWNSETGAQTFGIAKFFFDFVCGNRTVWGAEGYDEIRIRHTSNAPARWVEGLAPAIEQYAQSSTLHLERVIANAQAAKVDKVEEFLRKRFSAKQSTAIAAAHMSDEQRPMETIWDISTGITAFARSIPHQDERVKLEREAGNILAMVA